MDAIILFDYKNYTYSCAACGWSGSEVDLDVVTKISMNLVCCPDCKNDDVRIINEIVKAI